MLINIMIRYPREEGVVLEKDAKSLQMFEWAEQIGVRLNPKIQYPVLFPPGYLGMQTCEEILPGENILSAPNSSMLSMKLINNPILLPIFESNPSLFSIPDRAHEDNRMIVYFLYEQSKGPESIWHHYISFLPKDVETIIDWNDEDLAQLQDSDFEYDSKFRRERDFTGNTLLGKTLENHLDLFRQELLNIENINWVWKILCTRSYGRCIPYNSLIPLADLFNHSNVNTNYFYATEEEKCPDFDNTAIDENCEDTDDPLIENIKPLQMASLKLFRLSLGWCKDLTEKQLEITKEIVEQCRLEDSQSFVKSTF